jgi:hypothetical protein
VVGREWGIRADSFTATSAGLDLDLELVGTLGSMTIPLLPTVGQLFFSRSLTSSEKLPSFWEKYFRLGREI